MKNQQTVFDDLKIKVEHLVRAHKKLLEKSISLENEQLMLLEKIENQKNAIKNLEESNKIAKLAQAISQENENTSDVKSKINELVREIDKCMALLNE
ncbi:MAG: hypothetical protein ABI199_02725 [Bacteroidia bacterium]